MQVPSECHQKKQRHIPKLSTHVVEKYVPVPVPLIKEVAYEWEQTQFVEVVMQAPGPPQTISTTREGQITEEELNSGEYTIVAPTVMNEEVYVTSTVGTEYGYVGYDVVETVPVLM